MLIIDRLRRKHHLPERIEREMQRHKWVQDRPLLHLLRIGARRQLFDSGFAGRLQLTAMRVGRKCVSIYLSHYCFSTGM